MAKWAAGQQAEQNKEMARVNREVSESHKRLIEVDANARKDVLAMQSDLQSQASEVGRQRDLLESERREIAGQRLCESILAPIIANAGPLLVCALVLVFCGLLVYGLRTNSDDDSVVAQVLVEELASSEPKLLPPDTGCAAVSHSERTQERLASPDGE